MDEKYYTDARFEKRFKMSKDSIRLLTTILEAEIGPKATTNHAYTAVEKLCIAIRLFRAKSYQEMCGDTQNLSQATCCRHLHTVVDALVKLGENITVFNTDPSVLDTVEKGFYSFRGTYVKFFSQNLVLFDPWSTSIHVRNRPV